MPAIAERKELTNWTPVGAVRMTTRTALIVTFLLLAVAVPVAFTGLQQYRAGDAKSLIIFPSILILLLLVASTVLVHALRERTRLNQIAERRRLDPDRPWLWEYPWTPGGMPDRTSGKWRNTGAFSLAMLLFLAPVHVLASRNPHDRSALIFIGLFDIFLVVTAGAFVYQALRRLKYGVVALRFDDFPFAPGQELSVRMTGASWLGEAQRVNAVLRCIEEKVEIRGSGKNRGPRIVPYRVYEDSMELDEAHIRQAGVAELHLSFTVPADAPGTALEPGPPTYWDLELAAETPGIDYAGHFLIPIYRS